MNCIQCREMLVDYIENVLEGDQSGQVERHLQQCPQCRAELEQLRLLTERLCESFQADNAPSLDGPVMNQIIAEQAAQLRRLKMYKRIQLFGLGATSVAAAACLVFVLFLTPSQNQRAVAAEVMAQAASEVGTLHSVHLKCRMRTLPADNFGVIGLDYDFVGIDVWRQWEGGVTKSRIEEPGRVIVDNGESTIMWMKPPNEAYKLPAGANLAGWLRDLADVERVLSDQLRQAIAGNLEMTLKHERIDGRDKIVITMEVKANDVSDYMRNKFIDTADTRRVFRFDAQNRHLEAMSIYVHAKGSDVLVFEVAGVEYDPKIEPLVFTLDLPKDVTWVDWNIQPLPDNAKYAAMTPQQVAEAFFTACGKEDWAQAEIFWCNKMSEPIRKYLGGLKIVSVGQPFQAKPYAGWFVPYEVILRSGETKKFNMALRNDNPAKRWQVDGGL
jgi:hypothetical protein